MTDPQQIRRALGDIRNALDRYPREALAEILAIVFKEFVVEGAQPLASGSHVLDARSDLEGMSFAELVLWLQTHLDLPELALFEVSGADVSVRVEGRSTRLRAAASTAPVATAPVPVPAPVTAVTPMPPAAPPPAAPTPAAAPAPAQPKEEPATTEAGTRFNLLEVD